MSAYKLPKVNCSRGAPMGRHGYGIPNGRVRLVQVYLDSGGYDNGGAYWGLGGPLYMAFNEQIEGDSEYRQFVRAKSRAHAADELDCHEFLVAPAKHKTRIGVSQSQHQLGA